MQLTRAQVLALALGLALARAFAPALALALALATRTNERQYWYHDEMKQVSTWNCNRTSSMRQWRFADHKTHEEATKRKSARVETREQALTRALSISVGKSTRALQWHILFITGSRAVRSPARPCTYRSLTCTAAARRGPHRRRGRPRRGRPLRHATPAIPVRSVVMRHTRQTRVNMNRELDS